MAQNIKRSVHNTANTKEGTEVQTWKRLKRIAFAIFESLLA